jgi:hypothetical protein
MEADYFCRGEWTRQITLKALGKWLSEKTGRAARIQLRNADRAVSAEINHEF